MALKLIACALPVMTTSGRFGDGPWRALRALAVLEATILTLYGLVFSVAGWLVESGLVTPGRGADRRAEAWHAFLWDPWFLLWGLLVCAALRPARSRRRGSPT